MTSWLGKSWWQGLGVLIAVLLTVGGLWWQQSRKELSYEVVSQTPLVSSQETVLGRLQVSFDGKPVENVSIVVLWVYNSGNAEILKSDYESPIQFSFGQGADILSAEIVSTTPAGIPVSLSHQGGSVVLSPVLLNSKDRIELRTIVSRPRENIVVSCRIAGVSNCVLVDPRKQFSWITLIVSALIGAGIGELLDVLRRGRRAEKDLKKWQDWATEMIADSKDRETERKKQNAELKEMLKKIKMTGNELSQEEIPLDKRSS